MKKVVFILFLSLFFSSCLPDDSVSATTDDLYFLYKFNSESYILEPNLTNGTKIVVTGSQGSGENYKAAKIYLPTNLTLGTHAITNSTDLDAYNAKAYISSQDIFEATTGTLTISVLNNDYIGGTFSFTASNVTETLELSEGSFRVHR